MPWKIINDLIGPGLHYSKPRQLFLDAIEQAEQMNRQDVVDHLKIILDLRDSVCFDAPKKNPD